MPEFTFSVELLVLFFFVGLLAQMVDGALGMAYGVISSTILLAFGIPPATASASVHAAEVFTTAASGVSHVYHRNIRWSLFLPLILGGMAGGVLGAYVLTGIDGDVIKPYIVAYLGVMGLYIIYRGLKGKPQFKFSDWLAAPLGVVGGFFDAAGGGGWGPTVTTTMVGAGVDTRKAIGTVNAAEFFVTSAISATFLAALVTGHWEDAEDITQHAAAIVGLILGGVVAAPFAGLLTKRIPTKTLTLMVGSLILVVTAYQLARLLKIL